MRKRWYVLAALLGLLAALAVWFWPESPRWVGHDGPGYGPTYMHGFTPDGRVYITVRTPQVWQWDEEPAQIICRRDAASGKLLSKVTLDCPDLNMHRRVRASPDGTTVLVGETPITDVRGRNFDTGKWYLHDGLTGKRRVGPLAGVASVGRFEPGKFGDGEFSPDGRWFGGRRADPNNGKPNWDGVIICSAETGEIVLELPNCLFAPDGRTVAVQRQGEKKGASTAPRNIQILELPSGQEVCRFDLPERNWSYISKWDGRYLDYMEDIPDAETGGKLRRICRIEATKDGVGEVVEQPHLSAVSGGTAGTNFWIAGPDCVTYCRLVPPSERPAPPPAWWTWTASKLGIHQGSTWGRLVTARLVDTATGTTRYELPHPVIEPIHMSPDGRLLAYRGPDDSVHVWDTAPPPRWPKALALAAAVAVSVLGLGRYRRRRQPQSPHD